MIDLKTNPDFLHTLAADTRNFGQPETAADIDSAAHDIKNLRDYAAQLEASVNRMSAELNSIRSQRDDAARALLAIIQPELESFIEEAVSRANPIDDLRDRVERLEDFQNDLESGHGDLEDLARDAVRDMVRTGDITVSLSTA